MSTVAAAVVTRRLEEAHELLVKVSGELSDDQLAWRPAGAAPAHAPSVGWHLWHISRWADVVQAEIPGLAADLEQRLGVGRQLWDAEDLAVRWGLAGSALGEKQTGWGLDDAGSASLKLPGRDTLLDYAGRAFARANRAVEAIDDELYGRPCTDLYGRDRVLGDVVLSHLTHACRHLGMIEALRGAMDLRGTATV